jgi:hypothetical protein
VPTNPGRRVAVEVGVEPGGDGTDAQAFHDPQLKDAGHYVAALGVADKARLGQPLGALGGHGMGRARL